jgi:hypothetical protein
MSEAANGEGTAPEIIQFPTTPTPETPPTPPPAASVMEPPADITGIETVEIRQGETSYETKIINSRQHHQFPRQQ